VLVNAQRETVILLNTAISKSLADQGIRKRILQEGAYPQAVRRRSSAP